MLYRPTGRRSCGVALLAEGVDRNLDAALSPGDRRVALLAEGVDRNSEEPPVCTVIVVALLAEGVDRNKEGVQP